MEWTGFGSPVFFPKGYPGCQAVKLELAAHGSDIACISEEWVAQDVNRAICT